MHRELVGRQVGSATTRLVSSSDIHSRWIWKAQPCKVSLGATRPATGTRLIAFRSVCLAASGFIDSGRFEDCGGNAVLAPGCVAHTFAVRV
jgi:hypothetical protein